jgi:hypothetical protein
MDGSRFTTLWRTIHRAGGQFTARFSATGQISGLRPPTYNLQINNSRS